MNNKKATRTLAAIALTVAVFAALAPAALANAAEPPGLVVISSFPPGGLAVSIRLADGEMVSPNVEHKLWLAYFRFYSISGRLDGAVLVVESDGGRFELPIPAEEAGRYSSLITLDVTGRSLRAGRSPARMAALILTRVVLTLALEGAVFYAFGARRRSSWIAFAAINLATQGALNLALSAPIFNYGWIFGFVFFEVLIFIAEAIAFYFVFSATYDGPRRSAAAYALLANMLSAIVGGMLISAVPI